MEIIKIKTGPKKCVKILLEYVNMKLGGGGGEGGGTPTLFWLCHRTGCGF